MIQRGLILMLTILLSSMAAFSQTKNVSIALNAGGELLITAPDGKRIGFDSKTGGSVEEIAGAEIKQIGSRTTYRLPVTDETKFFTIQLSGKNLTEKTKTDLAMTGENFVARFDDILLDPKEILTVKMRADGRELDFMAGKDGETPTLALAIDSDKPDEPSYSIKILISKLAVGKSVFAGLDAAGKLTFGSNATAKNIFYKMNLIRTNADGTEKVLAKEKFSTGKAKKITLDLAKWNF